MDPRKIGKALLAPHRAVMIALVPVAAAFLIYSMVFVGKESPIAYASYILAFYTLFVWCFQIPRFVRLLRAFRNENKYARLWRENVRLRVNVSLYASILGNIAYALFQLGLGAYHGTFWFYSLGAYYLCLAFMRLGLVLHTRKYAPAEKMHVELLKYRATGWVFLVMNLALSLIIFFMVYWNKTFLHHMITTIAMAAYTFTAFTLAVVNAVKYRKYNSPVFSASKQIGLAAACVSMLTLEATMLTTFQKSGGDLMTRKLFLAISGAAVSAFIIVMAVYMIVQGTKKLRSTSEEVNQNG